MPLFQDAIAFQLFPLNFKWGKGLCLRGIGLACKTSWLNVCWMPLGGLARSCFIVAALIHLSRSCIHRLHWRSRSRFYTSLVLVGAVNLCFLVYSARATMQQYV